MKKRIILICSLASSLAYSQVGIKTPTPTNTLDVNGTARIREVNPVPQATAITPVYTDSNGVAVKIPTVGNNSVRSSVVDISSGVTKEMLTGLEQGVYRVTVIIIDACGSAATADFLVHNFAGNSNGTIFYGLNGQGGHITIVDNAANNHPNFTYIGGGGSKLGVTWTGFSVGCKLGGNSTAFNYTLLMPAFGTLSIINNGNALRTYRLTATRLD